MNDHPLSIPYPWQQPQWQSFLQQFEQERLAHGFLLTGPQGLGKAHYADAMANYLLCHSPRSGLPCGECRSCLLNQSQTHPDKLSIVPESTGKQIKIDQIRQLSQVVSATAQQGGRKVITIGPVEQLNINAANALLKNLEEPTKDTYFVLYSHVSSGVIATIRSRCQTITMPMPKIEETLAWLKDLGLQRSVALAMMMNATAPLTTRLLLEDEDSLLQLQSFILSLLSVNKQQSQTPAVPDLNTVKDWLDIEVNTLLAWWVQLIYAGIKQAAGEAYPYISVNQTGSEPDESLKTLKELIALLALSNQQWLYRFMDKLLLSKQQQLQGSNVNKQLLLEELLLDWYAIMKTNRSSVKP